MDTAYGFIDERREKKRRKRRRRRIRRLLVFFLLMAYLFSNGTLQRLYYKTDGARVEDVVSAAEGSVAYAREHMPDVREWVADTIGHVAQRM